MSLVEKVKNISGEDVSSCYQCGMCSASCPVRFAMDLSPTQVIRLVQVGKVERIFESNTFWICSTCFACQARCPRNINITKVMEALRQIKLRKEQDVISINEIPKEELKILPPIALVSNFRKTTA
ncbi:heterodisulfide reductase [Candidatus Bathyarchaeota archaeon]|nr:4Fe-4S dicluster domain-containing protein [Candidatus Bathyarchaeota archaeon]RLI15014.1 MAG: heterodisulfide reductase [Candidatus Bathyarchaeota archaeon]RLI20776.1 MAG: heterodisulfide reductase [Candidatus Bathyarchaeota archaeon]RLI41931.1 MAG: heterodisulfide reductase [Candidatus Bathyarchaeota archaeon]